jgi:putative nucleotidyltransferase with HDIG domain
MERDDIFKRARLMSGQIPLKEVSACTEADILAQDISDRAGRKILSANTSVNGYVKSLLQQNGTSAVRATTFALTADQCEKDPARQLQKETRHNFLTLASGQKIEYAQFGLLAESLRAHSVNNRLAIIKNLMLKMRQYDLYTYTHCVNVSFYSMLIAGWLDLPEEKIRQAVECGLLHDVGKAAISSELLNKPGTLTVPEYDRIKQHATLGYRILHDVDAIDGQIKKAVLMHHERMDGSGYPFGLIPDDTLTKIIAIADVYDAITSVRVYKKRQHPFKVLEFFADKGAELFDQAILGAVLSNFSAMLIGSAVKLTSGETAKIVYVPPEYPCSMIVQKDCRYTDLYDLDQITEICPEFLCDGQLSEAFYAENGSADLLLRP